MTTRLWQSLVLLSLATGLADAQAIPWPENRPTPSTPKLLLRTYPVADLIVPVENQDVVDRAKSWNDPPSRSRGNIPCLARSLASRIERWVFPERAVPTM